MSAKDFVEAKRIAKYAINIYDASVFGWTDNSVAEKMGLPNAMDIIVKDFTSNTQHPRFIVLVDHDASSILLVIRGTYSIGDAIIDVVCDEVPFLEGFAHHGMVDGAHRILEKVLPTLKSLLMDEFPGFKLRITGHSLGAGTAELITMIILSSHNKRKEDMWLLNIDVSCVALAPPPVYRHMNPSHTHIPNHIQEKIMIFVNGNDCVPRLSLANCAWLLSAMKAIDNLNLTTYDKLSIIIQKGTAKELPIIQSSEIVNQNLKKVRMAIQGIDASYQEQFKYLNHPTNYVYYLQDHSMEYSECESLSVPKRSSIFLVRRKAKHFSHLLLVFSKMIAHHFQWSYASSLDKVSNFDGDDNQSGGEPSEPHGGVVASNQGSTLVLM